MINPFPGPIRILTQGVSNLDNRLERGQRQDFIGDRHGGDRSHRNFEELPT
jgi:hypothetical protein